MSFHKVLKRFEQLGSSDSTLRDVVGEATCADLIDTVLRDPPISLNAQMGNGPKLRHVMIAEELCLRIFGEDHAFRSDDDPRVELLQLIIKMPLTSPLAHKKFSQTENRFAMWIYMDMEYAPAIIYATEMVDLMVNCKRNPKETIDSTLRGSQGHGDEIVAIMNTRRFELLLNPYQRGQVRKYLRSMGKYNPTP